MSSKPTSTKSPTPGPSAAPGSSGTAGKVQQQVDEVVGIMHENINKVMERGEKLDSLQNKTEDLQQGALQFKRGASRVRKQMWWKNMKLNLIIGIVIICILCAIIIPIANNANKGEK